MEGILISLLDKDNVVRQQAEEALKPYKQDTATFIIELLKATRTQSNHVKNLAYVLLSQQIKFSSPDTAWKILPPETKQDIKLYLLEALNSEDDNKVLRSITHLISEIIGTVYSTDGEDWKECISAIYALIESKYPNQFRKGLELLIGLSTYISNEILSSPDPIVNALRLCFNDESLEKKDIIKGSEAFAKLVSFSAYKKLKPLQPLLADYLKAMSNMLDKKEEGPLHSSLEQLLEISESEPKFLLSYFSDLCYLCCKIAYEKPATESMIPSVAIDIILNVIERYFDKFNDKVNLLAMVTASIFKIMINTSESDAEWIKEEVDDGNEEDPIVYGERAFERLIMAVDQAEVGPILKEQILELMKSDDWRYLNASIVAISQMDEIVTNELDGVVRLLSTNFENAHPRVRYYCAHAVGKYAEEIKDFAGRYFASLRNMLPLLDDPVVKVATHCLAALSNIIEKLPEEECSKYTDELLRKLISLIKDAKDPTKEEALRCITSLAETTPNKFSSHIEEIITVFTQWMTQSNKNEQRTLQGTYLEAITTIAVSVGVASFSPYSEKVMTEMLGFTEECKQSKSDKIKHYLISSWQRFIETVKTTVPIQKYGTQLFALLENVMLPGKAAEGDNEEKEAAIKLIQSILENIKGKAAAYLEIITKIMLETIIKSANSTVRKIAANCMHLIICSANEAHANDVNAFIDCCTNYLVDSIGYEVEADVLVHQCRALKHVVVPGISNQNIVNIYKCMLSALTNSNQRKIDDIRRDGDEDVDQLVVDSEIQFEDKLQMEVSDVLGKLFQISPDLSCNVINHLYPTIISEFLREGTTSNQHTFAISLVYNMVKHLGEQRLPYYDELIQIIVKYSQCDEIVVRKICINCVEFIANTSLFSKYIGEIQNAIAKCDQVEQTTKETAELQECAVCALGWIINYQKQYANSEVLGKWISRLPLKDEDMNIRQVEIVCSIILDWPAMALDKQWIGKALCLLSESMGKLVRINSVVCTLRKDEYRELVKSSVDGMSEGVRVGVCKLFGL